MIKIGSNGITCTKGDIFNLLALPDTWDANDTYTAVATVDGNTVNFTCSLFRDQYVRLYSNNMNLDAGTGTLSISKNGTEVFNKPFIVEEVAHNG